MPSDGVGRTAFRNLACAAKRRRQSPRLYGRPHGLEVILAIYKAPKAQCCGRCRESKCSERLSRLQDHNPVSIMADAKPLQGENSSEDRVKLARWLTTAILAFAS